MQIETKYNYPDLNGKFGIYGGKFVPETLIPALNELEMACGFAVSIIGGAASMPPALSFSTAERRSAVGTIQDFADPT